MCSSDLAGCAINLLSVGSKGLGLVPPSFSDTQSASKKRLKQMKNKKLPYGILTAVIVIVGTSLLLNKPGTTPTSKGQVIVKQSGGAGLLTGECTDKTYLSKIADYIIEGTVERVESKWNEERI